MNFITEIINLNNRMVESFGSEYWSIYAFQLISTVQLVSM